MICVGLLAGAELFSGGVRGAAAEAPPAAVAVFNDYVRTLELRLGVQHRSPEAFLVCSGSAADESRLRGGELAVERLTPAGGRELPGALLHHWRGTAFAAGARAADFDRLTRDFADYPQHFAPQVLQARTLTEDGERVTASMRVRQKHVLTVVMDTTYDVAFGRLDAAHGYSLSRSMQISEIAAAGTARERALSGSQEHGFLWRQNTYWSYEERDGGLYLQIESVSLTRAIPRELGWAVGPFVESVPRDSLEFTLRAACSALRRL